MDTFIQKYRYGYEPVDPNTVPVRTLYDGSKIPAIGMGTFGSDCFAAEQVADAVRGAAVLGYRMFDCASVYGNEPQIGEIFKEIMANGITREELCITSKLWNDKHNPADVISSCKQSLKDLQLDYLDLYFIHWPFPNYHAPGCDVNSRSPDAKPYVHENYMATWHEMEKLVSMGLVRHIGTSNMTVPKLKLVLKDAKIKPAANEMELHPHFQQPELYKYCMDNGILPIGFCPVGSPNRPDRDKTETDTIDMQDPVIVEIADELGVHPAIVCIKWAVQRGHLPIPFSVHPDKYYMNLKCTTESPLSEEQMKLIEDTDKNCRLIKGQVFLWKDNQTWEDLWDLDGNITPP